ncbi:MAG: 4Fe-4S dicluster domain-containing protein [Ruminococcaceae bacterium]|nr:4Fe-4S dicluster domain-containing protein [Oscillospiraceae bacterium]
MDKYFHSVRLDKDKCRGCTNCIKRCPTQAIRVRNGKARIIKERCIDCGECIRVCPHHAKYASRDSLEQLENYKYKIALPAPALYGQFNNLDDVNIILNALPSLGFDAVFEVSKAAELVSEATRIYLETRRYVKPAISSACPAVVRLIRVCFPELIDNIILVNAPVEEAGRLARNKAVAKTGLKPEEIGVFFISPCPAKITSFKQPMGTDKSNVDGAIAINDIYPHLLKAMEKMNEHDEMMALHDSGVIGIGWATSGGEASGTLKDNALAADGIENCMKILEEVERGNLDSVDFIELNACQGGCVGGSLTAENPFIAKSRLMKLRKYNPVSCNHLLSEDIPEEMLWSSPIEPCDDVMKLADNVQEAMERMARMKELLKTFPGLDCGTCGAPGCRALAEDVVRGFTTEHDCVFRAKEELQDIDSLEDTEKLELIIPAPFRENLKED